MRKLKRCIAVSCLCITIGISFPKGSYAGGNSTIPSNNPLIEYTGRIDFSNSLAPVFSYSGVSIRACFSGKSIAAVIDDNQGQNYYNIILDGVLIDTLHVTNGKKTYEFAQGLEDTIHEIELFKRTELTFGKTIFYGFVIDDGDSLVPITNKRDKLIEFIGNSITCGYGNEGLNGGVFGATTENHYLTYAAITSRSFNARHLAVCRSGIGIYRNYDGPATGNTDCMTNYYTRTFLFDENPKYSFAERPDLVCIDLGTNDFSTTGGDSARFVNNYFRLIDTIQTKYSMPDIVCLLGPMLSGTSLNKIRKYLTYIANSATQKGKGNVYFFEMSAQTGDLGIGIDYHPTVAQHKRNANELTNYIKSIKGWKVNPLILGSTVTGAKHIRIEFNVPVIDTLNNFSGFRVITDGQIAEQDSCYPDQLDPKIVHLILKQPLTIGANVGLSYLSGTIGSADSVILGSFSNLNVLNTLTETIITKGTTSANGATVMLTFNKKIRQNSSIDGLTITDSRGIVAIDSFKIVNAVLTLFMDEKLMKADTVFVAYDGENMYGTDDMPLHSFSGMNIKNASTYVTIDITRQIGVKLYPNPNKTGMFYYSFSSDIVQSKGHLEVLNSKGAKLYSQELQESNGVIDFSKCYTKGLYIFDFTLDNDVVKKTVLLE